ncbi:hypothetical protein E3N88_26271 [Mikania micrantha]|uniref:Uncharacterized protein n=1 Tax=Mikania micrantha TaxID=192012 RepID=A0A5N6N854_9ASTR|nr:hypothetical protein E3N88_26271 [Mikania micrantha]
MCNVNNLIITIITHDIAPREPSARRDNRSYSAGSGCDTAAVEGGDRRLKARLWKVESWRSAVEGEEWEAGSLGRNQESKKGKIGERDKTILQQKMRFNGI